MKGIKTEQFEMEKEKLKKLHRLRDYLSDNFEETDPLYHQLMHITESAINEKIDDIALLRGAKIIKSHKGKKYVFEVNRSRLGVAEVYLNGERIINFMDEIIKVTESDTVYTDIVNGYASRMPDAVFVKALLYSPADNVSHLSDKVKSVLDLDIPEEILHAQKENLKYRVIKNGCEEK